MNSCNLRYTPHFTLSLSHKSLRYPLSVFNKNSTLKLTLSLSLCHTYIPNSHCIDKSRNSFKNQCFSFSISSKNIEYFSIFFKNIAPNLSLYSVSRTHTQPSSLSLAHTHAKLALYWQVPQLFFPSFVFFNILEFTIQTAPPATPCMWHGSFINVKWLIFAREMTPACWHV